MLTSSVYVWRIWCISDTYKLVCDLVDEIEQKISEMETLNDEIKQKTVSRGRSLEDALDAARKFWNIYNDLMSGFRDIQDCIHSQDLPQVTCLTLTKSIKSESYIHWHWV